MPFVAVYIDGTTQGTTSNIDGEYTLALAPGKYTIDYKLISFAMHQETVVISGENIVRNVQLKTAGIEMGGITVKVAGELARVSHRASAVRRPLVPANGGAAFTRDSASDWQRTRKNPAGTTWPGLCSFPRTNRCVGE